MDTRPRIPVPRRIKHTEAMLVGLLLLLLVVHQFGPIWTSLDQTILGDEETTPSKACGVSIHSSFDVAT